MTRHVNLMQPDILPGFGRWQVPAFAVALVATLAGAGLYTGYLWSQRQTLVKEQQYWQTQVEDSERRLATFRGANPRMASEADLLADNTELTQRLAERSQALSGLSAQLDVSARGFAGPLDSLSNDDLDGLWLTRIELQDSNSHLRLTGLTRDPGLVPRYLDQLEGSAFDGLSIRDLNIQQTGDESSLWRFSIADRPATGTTAQETR